MQHLKINPSTSKPPTRPHPPDSHSHSHSHSHPHPTPKTTFHHPTSPNPTKSNASLTFIGTATTLLHFPPLTILTDPNFLHAGDHVHLGPGVTATRRTDPSINLDQLPNIDLVLLSHYHADHFDQAVEADLRRDLPIITTTHAKECLVDKKEEGEKFEKVLAVDTWESVLVDVEGTDKAVKITAMPGKHVPPGILETANNLLGAVPPVNGWMLELGTKSPVFTPGYRIYITGDTLLIDDLTSIPDRYTKQNQPIDLMLAHLGGTTIPGPSIPLLMVTMDAKMGVELMKLVEPDVTIPIHYDDYDVFLSPLDDFKEEVRKAGLEGRVVFLDRGDRYGFEVRGLGGTGGLEEKD